jgi:ATP-dependent Clp protease ATP-binding subunit ClpC
MARVRFLDGPATLSDRARKAFQLAHQEALRLGHAAVGTEHLLLGLAKEGVSPAAIMLRRAGFDLEWLRHQIQQASEPAPDAPERLAVLPYAPELERFLDAIVTAAESSGVMPLTPQHLLAALTHGSGGIAADILRQRRVSLWRLRRKLRRMA